MNKLLIIVISIFSLLVSCNMDSTILNEETNLSTYDPHALGLYGYITNKGIMVEVSKVKPPLVDENYNPTLKNVSVFLYEEDTEKPIIELIEDSNYLFFTPQNYELKLGAKYYLKIIADDFDDITTYPQTITKPLQTDSFRIVSGKRSYLTNKDSLQLNFLDSIFYIEITKDNIMENKNSSYMLEKVYADGKTYFPDINQKLIAYDKPNNLFFDQYLNYYTHFSVQNDFLLSDSTSIIDDQEVSIPIPIDSILIQMLYLNDSILDAYEKEAQKYLYMEEPYFNILRPSPSNVSNGFGLLISAYIDEYIYIHDQEPGIKIRKK